jgi:predicted RND superfamily exporter protein
MGIAGFLGISLTTASAIAPIIILTIAVADSIHLLVSVLYYLRQGMAKNDAILEALRVNFQPVFLLEQLFEQPL